MPKVDDGLRYWRTLAEIMGPGFAGRVKVKIHGWDLSREPVEVAITEFPSSAGLIKRGTYLFVQVAEDPTGHLHLKDWEPVPAVEPGGDL